MISFCCGKNVGMPFEGEREGENERREWRRKGIARERTRGSWDEGWIGQGSD